MGGKEWWEGRRVMGWKESDGREGVVGGKE